MTSSQWLPQHAGFETVRRGGYSPEQVNQYLDRLEYDLRIVTADRDAVNQRVAELSAQLQATQSEAEEFRNQLDRTARSTPSMSGLSERMQRMIRLAEEEAAEIRARAQAATADAENELEAKAVALADERRAFEAEREKARGSLAQAVNDHLAEATDAAAQMRSAAAQDAAATLAAAQAEAARLVADATAVAEQTTAAARVEADRLVSDATRDTTALRAAAQQESDQQLAAAAAHRDQVTAEVKALAEAAAAERDRLDHESEQRRAGVEEDFNIVITARRTAAHHQISEAERTSAAEAQRRVAEATAEAQRLVADATAQAQALVADATAEGRRRVEWAAQESHRRVREADEAVEHLAGVRHQVLTQLSGMQPYLDQIQQITGSSRELLAESAEEIAKPTGRDFDPHVDPIDFDTHPRKSAAPEPIRR